VLPRQSAGAERTALVAQIERLREEHRDLDTAIEALRKAAKRANKCSG
jgi:hypothetical protein